MLKIKRLIAAMIDFIIVCTIATCLAMLFNRGIGTWNQLMHYVSVYCISMCILLILKDNIFKNASIGKKIVKLHIEYRNPKQSSVVANLKRTIALLLLPFEIFLIFMDNQRVGDMWAQTIVVED